MKTFALVLSLFAFSSVAKAAAFHTSFKASMWINSTPVAITSEGRIPLPGILTGSGWTCSLTAENISDDGSKTYRNIACVNGEHTVVTTASCNRAKESVDDGDFSIIVGNTRVEFLVLCATVATSTGTSL